jgi:hypothetical protein
MSCMVDFQISSTLIHSYQLSWSFEWFKICWMLKWCEWKYPVSYLQIACSFSSCLCLLIHSKILQYFKQRFHIRDLHLKCKSVGTWLSLASFLGWYRGYAVRNRNVQVLCHNTKYSFGLDVFVISVNIKNYDLNLFRVFFLHLLSIWKTGMSRPSKFSFFVVNLLPCQCQMMTTKPLSS